MTKWVSCVVLLCSVSLLAAALPQNAPAVLKIPMREIGTDRQFNYIKSLLEASLRVTESRYGKTIIEIANIPVTQKRQMKMLSAGDIDVGWSVMTKQREAQYLTVDFPLYGNLFSYRVLLIRADDMRFTPMLTLDALKQMTAVQGHDWPDYYVMRQNGFHVTSSDYNTAFRLLSSKRVDYFPRAAVEVCEEVASRPTLSIARGHVLAYPNTIKFILRQGEEALAERIRHGLETLSVNGTLINLIQGQAAFQQTRYFLRHAIIHALQTDHPDYSLHPFSQQVFALINAETEAESDSACMF